MLSETKVCHSMVRSRLPDKTILKRGEARGGRQEGGKSEPIKGGREGRNFLYRGIVPDLWAPGVQPFKFFNCSFLPAHYKTAALGRTSWKRAGREANIEMDGSKVFVDGPDSILMNSNNFHLKIWNFSLSFSFFFFFFFFFLRERLANVVSSYFFPPRNIHDYSPTMNLHSLLASPLAKFIVTDRNCKKRKPFGSCSKFNPYNIPRSQIRNCLTSTRGKMKKDCSAIISREISNGQKV